MTDSSWQRRRRASGRQNGTSENNAETDESSRGSRVRGSWRLSTEQPGGSARMRIVFMVMIQIGYTFLAHTNREIGRERERARGRVNVSWQVPAVAYLPCSGHRTMAMKVQDGDERARGAGISGSRNRGFPVRGVSGKCMPRRCLKTRLTSVGRRYGESRPASCLPRNAGEMVGIRSPPRDVN